MMMLRLVWCPWSALVFLVCWLGSWALPVRLSADTIFVEAETFRPSSPGWTVAENAQTRQASRAKSLWGANGPGEAVAVHNLTLSKAGRYRIWVRYLYVGAWRGPFRLAVSANDRELAAEVFDLSADPQQADWEYVWKSVEANLPAGEVTLTLAKHEQKNCVGYVRHVDCLLLTTDLELTPNHIPYGPQTWLRVTLGEGYERPVYMHLFADHYRAPWYAHFALARDGLHAALAPPADQKLTSGQSTAWCNLTPTIYQDSGAALNLSVRYTYHEKASRLRAKLEFGRSASAADTQVQTVKTFNIDAKPNGVVIIAPPDLESPENLARLQRDRDFAEATGRRADAFDWPTHGQLPEKIPFLVSANLGGYDLPVDAAVRAREQKTLDYFGFNGGHERLLHGLWYMHDGSYCRPDLEKMQARAAQEADAFRQSGRKWEELAAFMLMDEPTGQPAAFTARDPAYRERFRQWLQEKGLTPQELLVNTWDDVRPVAETDRHQFPALHYYTQLFRTRALGDFMAVQRQILEAAYGRSLPTLVNLSDGAVYHANFFSQGVDYFELLDDDRQNAIWGEDWANNASTYQCSAYNVDLMRAAARKRGQTIGHHLIAHAGRTAWDIKTKAVSETTRGVRLWMNFAYGPSWGSHEGGPPWRTHLWYAHPELWRANAEITREIGAVEDWLLTARPSTADVAILYSSSSDAWTLGDNLAYGFDRMHTWLALAHAQTPVDIVPEREVADGRLDHYQVCYLSGPNLTRAAAEKLRSWIEAGGTLWLTAGAAERDEFNRPLDTLTSLLPATRGALQTHDRYQSAGRFLVHLPTRQTVAWGEASLEALSVTQPLTARDGAEVLARFEEGHPAVIAGRAGQGRVIVSGFLPGLSYIKPALADRLPLEQQAQAKHAKAPANADQPEATSASAATAALDEDSAGDDDRLTRSYNPWRYPAAIRERLLTPVRLTQIAPPLICDTPLVDAVALPCDQGVLVALANYTLRPQERITLELSTEQPVARITSVRHGELDYEQPTPTLVRWTMPLDASDFVQVWTQTP